MRRIPVSEKNRGIKSDGIIYRGLAKYRSIPCGVVIFKNVSSWHNLFHFVHCVLWYRYTFSWCALPQSTSSFTEKGICAI